MSGPPLPPAGFTHRVERSPLLDRLQSFLPQLKAANEQLEKDIKTHGAEKYSFEDTTGCENPIRVQLSIGVLEPKKIDPEADAKRAAEAEMNPHNLVVLPSELNQKKKETMAGDIVMPWDVMGKEAGIGQNDQNGQEINSTHTGPKMVTEVNSDEEVDDCSDCDGEMDSEQEGETGIGEKKNQRIKRQKTQNAASDTVSLEPLLGAIGQPTGITTNENESMSLGSHLFNEEEEVISTAEAVKILHSLGYEAVGNISAATPYHTADEIDREMKDE